MARTSVILSLLLLTASFPVKECARILGVFQFNSKSHFIMYEALMKGLADRGHHVVVLNNFPQSKPYPNYTDIDVSGSAVSEVDNCTIDTALATDIIGLVDYIWTYTRQMCRDTMDHPNSQALLKSSENFDLVITEIFGCECTIGFAHKFKAPVINVISSVALPWAHSRIGNTDHPAYVPNYFMPYSNNMNFWQRLVNTLVRAWLNIGNHVYNNIPTSTVLREYFGDGVPSLEKLINNVSLVLVNSHFSVTGPRPAVPSFIEVGGLHIRKPEELPQDIQKFFDESEHGVVYFSLGTMVQIQTFPPDKLKSLLDAFGALRERVLMKYTGDTLPGKPKNVMTSKWAPQLAVLSHPNTKLFISHGGLMGTQESVHAGVPILGIPLFADQDLNIIGLARLGMAMKLSYYDITRKSLLKAIRTVIDDPSFSASARRLSALFRDRPTLAMETAVFWVEYVLRHRGGPHLRSAAADMQLYQYLLLDVIGVLLLVIAACSCVIYCTVKAVLRALAGGKIACPRAKHKPE